MYKRVLTVQDISCFGQCSLTVALPIISACGVETAVLPSAVLSTHTGGFAGWTFRDLTCDMRPISAHWMQVGINFDAFYTGYLGSILQIDLVKEIMQNNAKKGALKIIDPAMADNGHLYPGFNDAFVSAMKSLCSQADIVLPNVTEACMLTNTSYKESFDKDFAIELCKKICAQGAHAIVLTGIVLREGYIGTMFYENSSNSEVIDYYEHKKVTDGFNGTGDCFASAFVGALMRGKSMAHSMRIAADFVLDCIEKTYEDKTHWYGVKFELALPSLIAKLVEE